MRHRTFFASVWRYFFFTFLIVKNCFTYSKLYSPSAPSLSVQNRSIAVVMADPLCSELFSFTIVSWWYDERTTENLRSGSRESALSDQLKLSMSRALKTRMRSGRWQRWSIESMGVRLESMVGSVESMNESVLSVTLLLWVCAVIERQWIRIHMDSMVVVFSAIFDVINL